MWGRAVVVVVVGEGLWLVGVGVGVMVRMLVRVQLWGGGHPLLRLLHRVVVLQLLLLLLHRVVVMMMIVEIRRSRHVGERLHVVVLAHRLRESAVEAGRGGEWWWRGIRRGRR